MHLVHQDGPAARPDEGWRDAGEILHADEGTDLMSRLEALGADPVVVARYLVLWEAIWGKVPHKGGWPVEE